MIIPVSHPKIKREIDMCIINEWNALNGEQQLDLIARCITKAAKQEHLYGVDVAEYVGGTWERIAAKLTPDALNAENARRAAEGKQEITLVSVVYHAAAAAIAAEVYQARKHSVADDVQITDEHGNSRSFLEAVIASGHDSTETSAIIRADFERFTAGRDETDQRILELAAGGYTEREIAATIGSISNVAVHKRLVKMRVALRENIG